MKQLNKLRVIDTHCHLAQAEFDPDLDRIIKSFEDQNVAAITSAILPINYEKNLAIARANKAIYAALGLDPSEFSFKDEAIQKIQAHRSEVIAIGEVGIDHFIVRDHKLRELQEQAFRDFIQLADEFKLPLQVHSRSAGRTAVRILREMEADQVHMHAFDGKSSIARTASNDYGYYFSIPTSVVRSPQKQKLVRAVNIERLLVETDSPVLSPVKGERNEPANVWIALEKTAEILGCNKEELADIVLENTLRLYKRIKL